MSKRCKNIRVHITCYFDDVVKSFQNDQSCLICMYYVKTTQLLNKKSFSFFLSQTLTKEMLLHGFFNLKQLKFYNTSNNFAVEKYSFTTFEPNQDYRNTMITLMTCKNVKHYYF